MTMSMHPTVCIARHSGKVLAEVPEALRACEEATGLDEFFHAHAPFAGCADRAEYMAVRGAVDCVGVQ